MAGRRTGRAIAAVLATGVVAALVLSGCGGTTNDSGTASRPQREAADVANKGGAAQAPGAAAPQGTDTQAKAPVKVVPDERSIIYTGSITVRATDVNAAASAAATLATGAGGVIAGDERTSDNRRSEAKLVLRVPSDRFNAVLNDLAKLPGGTELKRAVSTEDVTEQVVDVNSRVATAQASVDRVRALLARAGTIGEIVQLEAEVSRREAELESLKARQRKLTDLTALSTITVTLLGEDAPTAGPAEPQTGFMIGLKGGWQAFLASLQVLLTILGALLPWFLALGLPVFALVWLLRRNAARRRPVPPPVESAPVEAAA
jgi:hypothetical protein